MTLLVEKGTFTKTTSTSTPVSQQVNLSNGSLTPKALILWTNGQTTNDGTYAENIVWSFGFSDGTNDVCHTMTAGDNLNTQVESFSFNNNCIISICNPTGTPAQVSRADVTSFNAGNFVLNWSVQTDTTAMVIHYTVIGGTDITNVSAFDTTIGDASTGNHSYSPGSGTTFTPDFALCMTCAPSYSISHAINGLSVGEDDAQLNIGAARTTTEQFCMSGRTESVGTADTDMDIHDDACIMALSVSDGTEAFLADFVSFDNVAGGGITVNITNSGTGTDFLGFLLIKGGVWEVGSFQQRSGTGTQDVSFGQTTLDPALVFLAGINSATANATQVNNYLGMGASDGTNEGCSWCGDMNGQGTMVNTRANLTTKVYRQATPNATASSSTTDAECDMNDMATAGKFQLNWTTADTTLRQLGFWTVGTLPTGTTYERSPSTDTVTVSEASLTRMLSSARAPSTDSSTISDSSLTRLLSSSRAPSTDSSTITDASLTGVIIKARAPSEDTTSVSEASLTTMLSYARTPSESDVTVGEDLSRSTQAFRAPTADDVTVSDASLTVSKVVPRAPETDSVTVSDVSVTPTLSYARTAQDTTTITEESLTRILSAARVPSEDTTIVGESVSGGKLFDRSPSIDTITISEDAIVRILSASRADSDIVNIVEQSLERSKSQSVAPSPDTTTVSDASLTTSMSWARAPSLDSTTITDASLTISQTRVRLPSADDITVADSSLTRMLSAVRIPSQDTVTIGENVTGEKITAGQFDRTVEDTVNIVEASLTRMLSLIRTPTTDTQNVSEEVSGGKVLERSPSADTITISDATLTRILSLSRTPTPDTISISEEPIARLLSASRVPAQDTVTIGETLSGGRVFPRAPSVDSITISEQSLVRVLSVARTIQDSVTVIDASLQRMISSARTLSDIVAISELSAIITHIRMLEETISVSDVSLNALATYIRAPDIDSTAVGESIFYTGGTPTDLVSYALPADIRPLLGNIGNQRTDSQIQLAIESATDEINRKTNREPPTQWTIADEDFDLVKKLCRYIAALEMSIGIKDFQDRDMMKKEIEDMFKTLIEHDTEADSSTDFVESSENLTYPLNSNGIIYSTRYKNLKKSSTDNQDDTLMD